MNIDFDTEDKMLRSKPVKYPQRCKLGTIAHHHNPSKMSPTAEMFKAGTSNNIAQQDGDVKNAASLKADVQDLRLEILRGDHQFQSQSQYQKVTNVLGDLRTVLRQMEEGYTAPDNFETVLSDLDTVLDGLKPQDMQTQSHTFYPNKQSVTAMWDSHLRATTKGLKYMCVGCGLFAKKTNYQTHNWVPITEYEYRKYATAPPCPSSSKPVNNKRGTRQAEKE
jgi:hypothetical protein